MLPLEKIVALIIFLIVLVVLLIFTDIPKMLGGQTFSQQELRKCCQTYIARGCPDSLLGILCNSKDLDTLAKEVGFVDASGNGDVNLTRDFCNCP